MEAKEYLQGYLLKKLRGMEEARERVGKVPTAVLLTEYHDSIMEDMRAALAELSDHGIVATGPTLNDTYLHVNPENALEN